MELRLRCCRGKGGSLDPSNRGTWRQADWTHPQLGAPIHAAPAEAATEAAAPGLRRQPPATRRGETQPKAVRPSPPRPAQDPPTLGSATPLQAVPRPGPRGALH